MAISALSITSAWPMMTFATSARARINTDFRSSRFAFTGVKLCLAGAIVERAGELEEIQAAVRDDRHYNFQHCLVAVVRNLTLGFCSEEHGISFTPPRSVCRVVAAIATLTCPQLPAGCQ